VTQGIRIGATGFFVPDESNPQEDNYVFGYRIIIKNQGDTAATLLSRYWLIIDADGEKREVRGEGVVGQKPRLEPDQGFKYTSLCPLATSWGTMEGYFQMQRDDGTIFNANIKRFYLHLPTEVTASPEQ
jgi:ApaG protein